LREIAQTTNPIKFDRTCELFRKNCILRSKFTAKIKYSKPHNFSAELKEQFKDSHSKIVFCSNESLPVVIKAVGDLPALKTVIVVDGPENQLPSGVIHLNNILRNKINGVRFYSNIDIPRDLVSLPYSSGTTGRPKGVSKPQLRIIQFESRLC
jgi:acyl-CoA synthetase (AMP-forming)/AMP-acid ligase II